MEFLLEKMSGTKNNEEFLNSMNTWFLPKRILLQKHKNNTEDEIRGIEGKMKEAIHPDYVQTTIRCACGNEIEVGSTRENIRVEICSKCHPFFTGKQKLIDTAGRIERFRKKYEKFQKQAKPT